MSKLSTGKKAQLFDDIINLLGIDRDKEDSLPDIIRELALRSIRQDVLVAFAVDPSTGAVKQVGLSNVPRTAQNLTGLSSAAMNLARIFQDAAREDLENVGKQGAVGETEPAHRDVEQGDGGSTGHDL